MILNTKYVHTSTCILSIALLCTRLIYNALAHRPALVELIMRAHTHTHTHTRMHTAPAMHTRSHARIHAHTSHTRALAPHLPIHTRPHRRALRRRFSSPARTHAFMSKRCDLQHTMRLLVHAAQCPNLCHVWRHARDSRASCALTSLVVVYYL